MTTSGPPKVRHKYPPPPPTSKCGIISEQFLLNARWLPNPKKETKKKALVPGRTDTHWPQADGRGSWFDRSLRRFSQLGFSAVLDGQSTTPGQSCPSAMSSIVRGRLFFTEMLECHSRTRQTDANSPSFDDVVSL